MKTIKSTCLALILAAGSAANLNAETSRTDINPALLYYQAFAMTPELSPTDHDYLFTNNWWGQKLPDRFGELVGRYDSQFKLVRQASHATVPCDWGIDWSPGPATLLPGLARCKAVVVAARLRALWDLQNGRQAEAAEDLVAAFALGRNTSRDGSVISTLVQIAIENIACSAVAENFYRFSPETLKQLADGFDAAPPRGTMAAAVTVEKSTCRDWLVRKVLELKRENPGDDAKVMAELRKLFDDFGNSDDGRQDVWTPVAKAAGGTSDGILKLLREEDSLFAQLAAILALPQPEYESQMKQFTAELQKSQNPLVSMTFPALEKARPKEFTVLAKLAMVRAAVEYKLQGETGLQGVKDPFGNGPFSFQRFVFEGVDRGFELKSAYAGRGFPEVLIFVETEGPRFLCDGYKAGQSASQ